MPLFSALQAVVIPVRDMPRSQRFYRETLELAPLLEADAVSVYATGNCELCLQLATGDAEPATSSSYPNLRSADAAATRAQLLARGVECGDLTVSGPVTWFAFRDPDGNRLDCCAYAAAAY